jgi:hypothetical protein
VGLKRTLDDVRKISMVFYKKWNNGVCALVSSTVADDMDKHARIYNRLGEMYKGRDLSSILNPGLRHLGSPVFTFVSCERFKKSPWFTGDEEFLDKLLGFLREEGHSIRNSSIFVPFSNGFDSENMVEMLQDVTTSDQFTATFGISIDALKAKM